MGDSNVAGRHVAELMGAGGTSHSPEVPVGVLSRDAGVVVVGQVGYRISKYGVSGVEYIVKAMAEAGKSEAVKKYSTVISRGITGAVVLTAFFLLRGVRAREATVGAAWEHLTYLCDVGEEYIRKAIGV